MAIVGMACRLPGGASRPDELWRNLLNRVDAVRPPPPGRPTNGRDSGYLSADEVARFDHRAFGIGLAEAKSMDPQQRLLLQTALEAFEDGGVRPVSPGVPGTKAPLPYLG